MVKHNSKDMVIDNYWALSWSKWANKSRKEIIEMTNNMMTQKQCKDRLKYLRKTYGWYLKK